MYGDICLPDATAFLIQAERSLARLAKLAGRNEMAKRRLLKIEKGVNAMRRHMWDNEAGLFLAVKRDSLEKIQVPCISGFIPLFAEVPTPEQAARMANELRKPDWFTHLPIPSAPRGSKWFDDDWGREVSQNGIMWRGDVWNQVNYLICTGLAAYGYKDVAAEIADLTVDNVLIHGFNERYHPDSGKPLGVQNLGMSCAAVTMMLEGLTSRHKLMLRETK
jgi:neutral trehalase